MRPHWILSVVLAIAGCAAREGSSALAGAGADTAAVREIRQVLEEQESAWNRGDLEAFMEGYWRSDSLTFYSGGDVQRTWRGTLERYERRYRGAGREMGRLASDVHEVTMLAPDAALVRGAWRLERRADAPRGLYTLIVKRIPGVGWRIVHDHSSVAAADSIAPPAAPTPAGATDPALLRRAPTTITIDGRALGLSASLWRDMMPGPPPSHPRPLHAVVTVAARNGASVPAGVELDRLWVLKDSQTWNVALEPQPTGVASERQASARGGPEWPGGTTVTTVVRLRRGDETWWLRADGQRVELAH